MTVLESFMSFARQLPADRLEMVEEALASLMASYSGDHQLTGAELAELDRRVADPAAKFADPRDIAELFGKPLGA